MEPETGWDGYAEGIPAAGGGPLGASEGAGRSDLPDWAALARPSEELNGPAGRASEPSRVETLQRPPDPSDSKKVSPGEGEIVIVEGSGERASVADPVSAGQGSPAVVAPPTTGEDAASAPGTAKAGEQLPSSADAPSPGPDFEKETPGAWTKLPESLLRKMLDEPIVVPVEEKEWPKKESVWRESDARSGGKLVKVLSVWAGGAAVEGMEKVDSENRQRFIPMRRFKRYIVGDDGIPILDIPTYLRERLTQERDEKKAEEEFKRQKREEFLNPKQEIVQTIAQDGKIEVVATVVGPDGKQPGAVPPAPLAMARVLESYPEFSVEKLRAAVQLAAGNTISGTCLTVGILRKALYEWRQDPEFMDVVAKLKAEWIEVTDARTLAALPDALNVAIKDLGHKSASIRLKAVDRVLKFREYADPKPKDGGTKAGDVNVNMQIVNGKLVPVPGGPPTPGKTIEEEIAAGLAPVRSIEEFFIEDLGIPIASVYPRILWLLKQIERRDVRRAVICGGKGIGKTTLGGGFMARCTQRLMSVPNPPALFNLMPGTLLGIINVSASERSAQLAVFHKFSTFVDNSPWFKRWAKPQADNALYYRFPRNTHTICGNSSTKGVEGLDLVYAVVDEVSRLVEAKDKVKMGGELAAEALVGPILDTLVSRAPKDYKLVIISWPEHQKDYLYRQIEKAREAGVKEDLTKEFNEQPIVWGGKEADAARKAAIAAQPFAKDYPPEVWISNDGDLVVIAPTWLVKPDADLGGLAKHSTRFAYDFARRFGARPKRRGSNPAIQDMVRVRSSFNATRGHPFTEGDPPHLIEFSPNKDGTPKLDIARDNKPMPFEGDGDLLYYGHIDIGHTQDAAGIAVGHYEEGRCVYDVMLEITPEEAGGKIRLKNLFAVIYALARRGFTFDKVTVDGFQGIAATENFEDHGIGTEIFSVDRDRKAYDTFLMALAEEKLDYYDYEPFYECCESLVDLGKKIEHTLDGKKDLTDAMAAVAFHVFESVGGLDQTIGNIE